MQTDRERADKVQTIDMQEIDRQHQQLIAMLNKLNDAVKCWKSRDYLYHLIDEVIEYTCFHFATEEQLMVQSAFPDVEAHKAMHQQLVQDALNLKGKLVYVGEEMFTEWFDHWPFSRVLAHIEYADKQLEEHIIQRAARQ